MSSDLSKQIDELRHTITVASLNYDVWWVYKSSDTRPTYVQAMNRYNPHFNVAIHAHFVALVVALYRLYEMRRDTYNIPKAIKSLNRSRILSADDRSKLKQLHERDARPLWEKVKILRNKAFGHRAISGDVEAIFKQANKVDGVKSCIMHRSMGPSLASCIGFDIYCAMVDHAKQDDRIYWRRQNQPTALSYCCPELY